MAEENPPTRAHDGRYNCARSLLKFVTSDGYCVVCGRRVSSPGLSREQVMAREARHKEAQG